MVLCYLSGIPHCIVIGQVHEFIDKVRLVKVIGN